MIILVCLSGCSPAWEAEQAMRINHPVRATMLYEDAIREDPADPELRQALAEARVAAGEQLARRAQLASDANAETTAIHFATRAAWQDPIHRDLESSIRRHFALKHLDAAESAMDRTDFAWAQIELDHALSISTTLPEASELIEKLKVLEAHREQDEISDRVAILIAEGRIALADGRYERAANRFELAYQLKPEESVAVRIRELQAEHHRRAAYLALDQSDTPRAIEHISALLQIVDDPAAALILEQLQASQAVPPAPLPADSTQTETPPTTPPH